MIEKQHQRVLITILNWGLGHATRCIPVIRQLQAEGHDVVLASDGRALRLLEQECPDLISLELPAHNIYYSQKNFMWSMAWQLPKIAWITIAEHFRVRRIVKKYQINLIISDNRFGCFHPRCQNIFMTHQLNIIVPNKVLAFLVQQLNQRWIQTFFDACWIPDVATAPNLSGVLSHDILLSDVQYIGLLSRMKPLAIPKKYDWIAVLSGPEPQRTRLEEIIVAQAQLMAAPFRALIIAGKSEANEQHPINDNLTYRAFVSGKELNQLMCAAELIICRSGYSTLMDLAAIGGKAILIPTPQQSEQEYLAEHLFAQKLFYTIDQSNFDLQTALKAAKDFPGFSTKTDEVVPFLEHLPLAAK